MLSLQALHMLQECSELRVHFKRQVLEQKECTCRYNFLQNNKQSILLCKKHRVGRKNYRYMRISVIDRIKGIQYTKKQSFRFFPIGVQEKTIFEKLKDCFF